MLQAYGSHTFTSSHDQERFSFKVSVLPQDLESVTHTPGVERVFPSNTCVELLRLVWSQRSAILERAVLGREEQEGSM